MIKIKNIEIKDQIIKCNLFPEDCKVPCALTYDIEKGQKNIELPEEYRYCKSHVNMAINWLKIHINEEMPKEKILMWY